MNQQQIVRFRAGQTIFEQGEKGREMYIIHTGRVRVFLEKGGRRITLTDLGPGSFIGEMSFLTGQSRSATVEAVDPVVANRLTPSMMNEETFGLPDWVMSLAQVMVRRLRRTTNLLADYIHQEPSEEEEPQKKRFKLPFSKKKDNQEESNPYRLQIEEDEDEGRFYLKGYFSELDVKPFHARLKEYRETGEVFVDFSGVFDLDRNVVGYLTKLTRVKEDSLKIRFENMQLIQEKVASITSMKKMMATTAPPERNVGPGETLIKQGDTDTEMFVVLEGSFRIEVFKEGKTIQLGTAGKGDIIGEMALFSREERSASVIAEEAGRVAVIDSETFASNHYNIPTWFLQIIQGLIHRINHTNHLLEEAVREDLVPPSGDEAAPTLAGAVKKVKQDIKSKVKMDAAPEPKGPFSLTVDPDKGSVLLLQGVLSFGALEYLGFCLNGLRQKGEKTITLWNRGLKAWDDEAASFLLNHQMTQEQKGGKLILRDFPDDIASTVQPQESQHASE